MHSSTSMLDGHHRPSRRPLCKRQHGCRYPVVKEINKARINVLQVKDSLRNITDITKNVTRIEVLFSRPRRAPSPEVDVGRSLPSDVDTSGRASEHGGAAMLSDCSLAVGHNRGRRRSH